MSLGKVLGANKVEESQEHRLRTRHEQLSSSTQFVAGNERIASIFEEMSVVQKLRRDRFRSQAY